MNTLLRDLYIAMRMLTKRPVFTVSALVTLAFGLGANATMFLLMSGPVSAMQGRDEQSSWQWISNNESHKQEIKTRGDIKFTDDESDVKSISSDGYLLIREKHGATERQYEVRYAGNDRVERIYSVRGESRDIDQDARRWIAEMMLHAIRQSGFNASGRVERILKQNGATGVLAISLIDSDNAKRIYFEELIKRGNLNAAMTEKAIHQASREISSDGTKAALLEKWSELYTANDVTVSALIQGANSINSDGSRAEVLVEILRRPNLTRAQLSEVFRSIKRISSDSQKRAILVRIADNKLTDDSVVAEYISTLDGIGSDSEHRKALLAILNKQRVSNADLSQITRAARGISSDSEKSLALITVIDSTRSGDNNGLFAELLETSRSINSNGERSRILTAMLHKPNLNQDTFIQIFRNVDDLSSDGEKARVLLKAIAVCSNKDAVISPLLGTIRKINSDAAKVQVIASLMDKGGLSRSILEQTRDLAKNDINSSSARSSVIEMVNDRLMREPTKR